MAKKPSEWTPQEAWASALEAARVRAQHSNNFEIPFPADPPEVVSEEYLQSITAGEVGSVCKQNAMRMAAELLARREAERKA